MTTRPPVVLSIAGTDPTGGAGIQADLKVFTSLQCYGTSVTTAIVAQNTRGVQGIHAPSADFVEKQLQSLLDDFEVDALKTGVVASTLKSYFPNNFPTLVVDPVCVSTSGHTLLEPEALSILRNEILPLATIVTPNLPEAELLLSGSIKITSVKSMLRAAKALASFGSKAILLKGGHLSTSMPELTAVSSSSITIHWAKECCGTPDGVLILEKARKKSNHIDAPQSLLVVDILYQAAFPEQYVLFVRPRLETNNTHGTGCTLSAALTCELSRRKSIVEATHAATAYTQLAMSSALPLGKGNGPLNHLHPILTSSIPRLSASNPHPFICTMIQASSKAWKDYVQHPFVRNLGSGKLPTENFVHFIKQDYHYLKYYGRAHGLASAKSLSFETMSSSAATMLAVARETKSHAKLCKSYGISFEELINTPESPATTAYGAYLIDVGLRGDETLLVVALAACLLGYGEVGLWLQKEAKREESEVFLEGNPYRPWIEEYSGSDYQGAVSHGIEFLEAHIATKPPGPAQYEEILQVWEKCVKLETGFWDMANQLN